MANSAIPASVFSGNGAGAMARISEQVLGSDAATIDFASIPGTYRHLRIIVSGKASGTDTQEGFMRFNGDSGGNYDYQIRQSYNTTNDAGKFTAQTKIKAHYMPGSSAVAGASSSSVIDIFDYAGTTFHKTCRVEINGRDIDGVAYSLIVESTAGWWRSTAAITAISLYLGADSFKAGTVATLYGIS